VHVHITDTMIYGHQLLESSENVLVKSRRSVVDYDSGAFITGPSSATATATTHLPRSHSDPSYKGRIELCLVHSVACTH